MIPMPPPDYVQTTAAIVACGIPAENVRISYERELQSDEVVISGLDGMSDEKFRCLRGAVHPFYILTIENSDERAAFYEFSYREDRPGQKAEAIEWLRAHNILNRLPRFGPGEDLGRFAVALELACSLPAESALELASPNALTFRRQLLEGPFAVSGEAINCLSRMFSASDAEEHCLRLVILANAAPSVGNE